MQVPARTQPADQLALVIFGKHRDLLMIPAEVRFPARGFTAAEYRTGNDALLVVHQLARGQFLQRCTEHRAQQTWSFDPGASQRDDAFIPQ